MRVDDARALALGALLLAALSGCFGEDSAEPQERPPPAPQVDAPSPPAPPVELPQVEVVGPVGPVAPEELNGGAPQTGLFEVPLKVGEVELQVEVANTPIARQIGLMHRDALGEDRGMLFIYPDKRQRSFWMKGTRIPLAIAYISDEGEILQIEHMAPAAGEARPRTYPSWAAVRYALEVNEGWFAKRGIEPGAKVIGLEGLAGD